MQSYLNDSAIKVQHLNTEIFKTSVFACFIQFENFEKLLQHSNIDYSIFLQVR